MRLAFAFLLVLRLSAEVNYDRILNAGKEPQNWLTYSWGPYSGHRF